MGRSMRFAPTDRARNSPSRLAWLLLAIVACTLAPVLGSLDAGSVDALRSLKRECRSTKYSSARFLPSWSQVKYITYIYIFPPRGIGSPEFPREANEVKDILHTELRSSQVLCPQFLEIYT